MSLDMKLGTLLILDGMNIAHLTYPLRHLTYRGSCVGCVYGFCKFLQTATRKFQPSLIAVAWDGGHSKFRKSLYPEYKVKRKKPPVQNVFYNDLFRQLEIVEHKILSSLPIFSWRKANTEADDLIYVAAALLDISTVIIVSSDKDYYQLLSERVRIYSPSAKGQLMTIDRFRQEYPGMQPEDWPQYRSLTGDPSDCISGVPRVGEKTALKIMADGGLFRNRNSEYRKLIKLHAACLDRNIRLITLPSNPEAVDNLRYVQGEIRNQTLGLDETSLEDMFDSLGFVSFLDSFPAWIAPFKNVEGFEHG